MTIYFLNDHKVGFVVSNKIKNNIINVTKIPIEHKAFFYFNTDISLNQNDKLIIFIRHPKEIIISGYLYHKKCTESWCITPNSNYLDYAYKINNIDLNNKKYEKIRKLAYKFSDSIIYQTKINNYNTIDGIKYEMKSVAYITLIGLYKILETYKDNNNVLFIDLEKLIYDSENILKKIYKFINIDNKYYNILINKYNKYNILKKNNNDNKHITNIDLKKQRYLDYWNNELENYFNFLYPNDLIQLYFKILQS
jgi:hypothetical protein